MTTKEKSAAATKRQSELKALRKQQERQEAAIERQIRDLHSLQRGLIDNPDRTAAQDAHLNALGEEIRALQRLLAQLGAAYLESVAKIVDLEGLLNDMDNISSSMEEEAQKMEDVTRVVATAGKIFTLGTKAISKIRSSASG